VRLDRDHEVVFIISQAGGRLMAAQNERIAVVGAGLMGTSIALDWARAGHDVAT
jgi:NADPH-dependent 2,4-dienoyl-CoA reductase/sulfur reductase-like enzyme